MNRWPEAALGSRVICETRALPGAVIPAKAGIYSASHWKCAADGLDSRFRGNDECFDRGPIPNGTSTGFSRPPGNGGGRMPTNRRGDSRFPEVPMRRRPAVTILMLMIAIILTLPLRAQLHGALGDVHGNRGDLDGAIAEELVATTSVLLVVAFGRISALQDIRPRRTHSKMMR